MAWKLLTQEKNKMKKICWLGVLLLLYSCKQVEVPAEDGFQFYFENPQPVNDSELKYIPSKFVGLYKSKYESVLRFEKNFILEERDYGFTIHKNVLDSLKDSFYFSNGKLVEKSGNDVYQAKRIGDSIKVNNTKTDTLFKFSATQKAKRINGFLVLSEKDSIFWKIRLIGLDKNILKIRYLYSEEDVNRIDSITLTDAKKIDSLSFVLKPTRKEFKQILNLKNLGFESQFNKIKK